MKVSNLLFGLVVVAFSQMATANMNVPDGARKGEASLWVFMSSSNVVGSKACWIRNNSDAVIGECQNLETIQPSQTLENYKSALIKLILQDPAGFVDAGGFNFGSENTYQVIRLFELK